MPELECWNCHETFKSDERYEFPGCYVCWHECADGVMTQVTVKRKKVWRRFVPEWVKTPTAKDQFNRTLKLIYNSDKKINEDEFDE